MKKATPKKEDIFRDGEGEKQSENVTKIKKYLFEYFQQDSGYYIEKALVLLHQFQAGNLENKRKIQANKIYGISPLEISIVLSGLENAFGQKVLQRTITGKETLAPVDANLLNLAITFLEELNQDNAKFLSLREGAFYYHNSKLKIAHRTHTYKLLFCIYNHFNGQSGTISYEDLTQIIKKEIIYKNYTPQKTAELVQKYITSKTSTFGKKLFISEANGKPLFTIEKNFGLSFNNSY